MTRIRSRPNATPRVVISVLLLAGTAVAQDQQPDTVTVMQRNGNSLLQATINRGPVANTTAAVSFIAVPLPEPKIIRKHDLLTVVIRENSTFSSDGATDLKRSASINAAIQDYISLNLQNLALDSNTTDLRLRANASRDFKGEGKIDRKDDFSARLTCEVIDVKPNGTFAIRGVKRIQTDDDVQIFVLTGTARSGDVSLDNTVLSTQLHNLELTKTHDGPVRDATKRGWATRLLDALNPF